MRIFVSLLFSLCFLQMYGSFKPVKFGKAVFKEGHKAGKSLKELGGKAKRGVENIHDVKSVKSFKSFGKFLGKSGADTISEGISLVGQGINDILGVAEIKELVLDHSDLVNKNYFKTKQSHVRQESKISNEEVSFVRKRNNIVTSSLRDIMGMDMNGKKIPTIATLNSGGGLRAWISMIGFHSGLERMKVKAHYNVGLSGGAWFVSTFTQMQKPLTEYKKIMRTIFNKGIIGKTNDIKKMLASLHPYVTNITFKEQALIADELVLVSALEWPFTLVNPYAALLGNRYLSMYGNERHEQRFSRALSSNNANFPYPVLTAVNARDSDVTINRHKMNWYEFTPHWVGGVGPWLKNISVPTWAFGRKYKKGESVNFTPEYPLGLLMGIWGSAFGVTFKRAYEEIASKLGLLKPIVKKMIQGVEKSTEVTEIDDHIGIGFVHNFTRGMPGTPYAGETKLKMVDGGVAFNLPYPPVSGHGPRKADIMIFFDASGGIASTGPLDLVLAQKYAQVHNLKFPKIPTTGKEFKALVQKPVSIFKDENDPEVPLVIYCPAVAIPDKVHYDSSLIPKGYNTNYSTINFYYDGQNFDRLSKVTEQNIAQSSVEIKKAIDWKIRQMNGMPKKSQSKPKRSRPKLSQPVSHSIGRPVH